MPKRSDIDRILVIGAGPIVIGQACEFDYSGTQACKALKEEGYTVILVNSNPATIMTDPVMADATYIEPIQWQTVAKIIETERPDAILPTMGGQTALNCALDLERNGVLDKFNVTLIGANADAIDKAENRDRFDQAMRAIGLETPKSKIVHTFEEASRAIEELGFPCIIRPSFTMGGTGGGIAYNREEFEQLCRNGFELSPTNELQLDESLIGWKEFEMEVVRDRADNCIIICSIENLDPMGVHTGDSITVAPAQTLTDKEYQRMRNASMAILREIGVETGGSNVQFAVNPENGRMVVIEMNPRVSRSSALASKATGFPIAKIAAKLAVGYTLDELSNDITGGATPASFEPTIDYVVTKIPRFNFEKFPQADAVLTTQMKSVGEVMAIGRTFPESLQKAVRGLETGVNGLDEMLPESLNSEADLITQRLNTPGPERLWFVADAMRHGWSIDDIYANTHIDHWFLSQIQQIVDLEQVLQQRTVSSMSADDWFRVKRMGFSDARLSVLLGVGEDEIRKLRHEVGVRPVYKRVDTCAAEFGTTTAYLYSTYEMENEANPTDQQKMMILGGGPNRIGQGIEFDYCCVHAAQALRDDGYETIMVNCNPETVSTDYDESDRLYFEPVTLEDVLEIVQLEKPIGVIVQFGGQTPLRLAKQLESHGVPIIGTTPDAIDRAEDRERFKQLIERLNLKQPANETARTSSQAVKLANTIGYPLVVRPSYVLGGRAMEIVHSEDQLERYMSEAVKVSNESPVLLDRFLEDAVEVDLDAVSDGTDVVIGAIMEHIEQAGIHSGDSTCSIPPHSLSQHIQDRMREQATQLAREIGVVGLMNIQFAIQNEEVYIIEVNPRASRTIPYVSKAIQHSLARIAARCMAGQSLVEQKFTQEVIPQLFSVKKPVFPFAKFPGVDPLLGPEMKSTGEVMGIGETFAEAYRKAMAGAGEQLPASGTAFISVKDTDKGAAINIARDLVKLGFSLVATRGTTLTLMSAGIPVMQINKVREGRPHIVDAIKNDEIDYIINTIKGKSSVSDSKEIRIAAIRHRITYSTTISGAEALVRALKSAEQPERVHRLQDL